MMSAVSARYSSGERRAAMMSYSVNNAKTRRLFFRVHSYDGGLMSRFLDCGRVTLSKTYGQREEAAVRDTEKQKGT